MRRRRRIGCSAAATNGLQSCSPRHDRCKALACLNAATGVDGLRRLWGGWGRQQCCQSRSGWRRACCGRGECSASERSAAQDVDSRGTKSSWSRRPSVRIAGWTRSSGILPTLPVCNSSAPVRPGNTTAPPPRSGAPTSAATISQQVRLRWKEESERTCSDGTTFDLCCANSQRPRRTSKAHRSICAGK